MATEYRMHGVTVERERTDPDSRRLIRHAPTAALLIWVGKTQRGVEIPLDLAALVQLNTEVARALAALTEDER